MSNYFEYKIHDLNNGPGLRVCIWLSGCPHNCPNCFEKEGQSPEFGNKLDELAITTIKKDLAEDLCTGLSLLGGDPLAPCNYETTLELAKYTKSIGKTVYIWTGYKYEQIPYELDEYVDCYIDGMYIDKLKCDDAGRGSSNQRFMRKTKIEDKPIFYFKEEETLYD